MQTIAMSKTYGLADGGSVKIDFDGDRKPVLLEYRPVVGSTTQPTTILCPTSILRLAAVLDAARWDVGGPAMHMCPDHGQSEHTAGGMCKPCDRAREPVPMRPATTGGVISEVDMAEVQS